MEPRDVALGVAEVIVRGAGYGVGGGFFDEAGQFAVRAVTNR